VKSKKRAEVRQTAFEHLPTLLLGLLDAGQAGLGRFLLCNWCQSVRSWLVESRKLAGVRPTLAKSLKLGDYCRKVAERNTGHVPRLDEESNVNRIRIGL
jgi:hypothetical protein